MGKKMKTEKLLDSSIELGLRASIILDAYTPRFLSENELLFLDYILVHCNDFYDDTASVYPTSNFRVSDITQRKICLHVALKLYTHKGIIIVKTTPLGIKYRTGGKYPGYIKSIENEFIQKLSAIAKKIFEMEHDKTLSELYVAWRENIKVIQAGISIPLIEEVVYEQSH